MADGMRLATSPSAYWRALLAHGVWLLLPAVAFGGMLGLLLRTSPGVAPAAVLGAVFGLIAGILGPSRRRRRATNQ